MRPLNLSFSMDADFNSAMAERITRLRKITGLTQVDVANSLGVSQGTYAHYERGFRRIPLDRIPHLAQALQTSEEELLGLNQKNHKRGPLSLLEKRFQRIRSLPADEQQFVIKMLDKVLGEERQVS